jgi:hypothetical protein
LEIYYDDVLCSDQIDVIEIPLDIHVCGAESVTTPEESVIMLLPQAAIDAADEDKVKVY